MSENSREAQRRATAGGLLVALGIIFGDIGTSPLYVLKAIVGLHTISPEIIYGGMSCIFWTLTFQTTIKYVLLMLEADNRGEGGIISLYALVRRRARWLIFPAIIGASGLLADGIITPPISVCSAIEGLRIVFPGIPTVPIVLLILVILFAFQQFGTSVVGRSFGPIMLLWFLMLGVLGFAELTEHPAILQAIDPRHAFTLLWNYPGGFWLLGAVFLCTTGAEALYSDLGHCGRENIRLSWGLVKTCLLLNYFGQSAWLVSHQGELLSGRNPFFELMPRWFVFPFGVSIATAATVIASQALISGSFTLVTEAMRLYLVPKAKVVYPTELKGQIYVPLTNTFLLCGCVGMVLFFKDSSAMEAAYGLAIIITMLMSTILFTQFLVMRRVHPSLVYFYFVTFFMIELGFLAANLSKFTHGGYVTLLVGFGLFSIMWIWNKGSMLKREYTEYVNFKEYLPMLKDLSLDLAVPKYATHLVYMTGAPSPGTIESKIVYSLFRKSPKRADVYWFIHVDVVDEPYTMEYQVEVLVPEVVVRIDFSLGFRMAPRINLLFRKVIEDLADTKEVNIVSRYKSLKKHDIPGDFRFVVLEKSLSYENDLPFYERLVMGGYFLLKRFSISEEESFGLDTSSVWVEKVPLVISPHKDFELNRIK